MIRYISSKVIDKHERGNLLLDGGLCNVRDMLGELLGVGHVFDPSEFNRFSDVLEALDTAYVWTYVYNSLVPVEERDEHGDSEHVCWISAFEIDRVIRDNLVG